MKKRIVYEIYAEAYTKAIACTNLPDKYLPMFVNCPFRNLINGADASRFFRFIRQGIRHIAECLSDINSLPVTRPLDVCAAALYGIQPFLPAFFARVPFYDEGYIVVFIAFLHKNADVFRSVIPGVKADEQRLVRQLAAEGGGFPQKIWRFFLAVLFPGAQLKVYKAAFCPDIGHDRRIAVKPFVSA